MQPSISTISDLLDSAQTQWRVYDMGRKISKISAEEFRQFEHTNTPWPSPIQQKAFFAVFFHHAKQSTQPFLWFLNFDLDEQGKLQQTGRDHFISLVLESLGTNLTEQNEAGEQRLKDTPYIFTPSQNKLASLHARLNVEMHRTASTYYPMAQQYFHGELPVESWETLGIQGIADFTHRLSEKYNNNLNSEALSRILPTLPAEVTEPLSEMLESVETPTHLIEKLAYLASKAINAGDFDSVARYIRSMSGSKGHGLRQEVLRNALATDGANATPFLLLIAARCWHDLTDDSIRLAYLDQLAQNTEGQAFFNGIFADLVAIPVLRHKLLTDIRSENRSNILATAIGKLFGQS